jgi:hypothetical protein
MLLSELYTSLVGKNVVVYTTGYNVLGGVLAEYSQASFLKLTTPASSVITYVPCDKITAISEV